MSANPFLDPALVHGDLYRADGRLADRTHALHRPRSAEADVAETIADLLAARVSTPGRPCSTSAAGAAPPPCAWPTGSGPRRLTAIDASAALLRTTRDRLGRRRRVGLGGQRRLPPPAAARQRRRRCGCRLLPLPLARHRAWPSRRSPAAYAPAAQRSWSPSRWTATRELDHLVHPPASTRSHQPTEPLRELPQRQPARPHRQPT